MMIVLTDSDLARMPVALRRELQNFLLTGIDEREHDESFDGYDIQDVPAYIEDLALADNESGPAKLVIEITEKQAKALIGNLSPQSISTLRLFAEHEAVRLEDILGVGKTYSNFTGLKRSFVGAVNRRLRTVTRNRSAVLFRKTLPAELDGQAGIAVRPQTAKALMFAFDSHVSEKGTEHETGDPDGNP
jgi:hypothetical protein